MSWMEEKTAHTTRDRLNLEGTFESEIANVNEFERWAGCCVV